MSEEIGSDGIGLTELEAGALAYRIVAQHVSDSDRWLEWEDYPYLTNEAFQMVDEKVREIGATTLNRSRSLDVEADIDSVELLERAVNP